MRTIKISYNPYKMQTTMQIDDVDVCKDCNYDKFKEFIEDKIPLQTWIEPILYRGWKGLVNEVSDPESNDQVRVYFSGRKIDFEDLKKSMDEQNERRSEDKRVQYEFNHVKVLDDKELSNNIDFVIENLKSDRFRKLVEDRSSDALKSKYENLDKNYKLATESEFYIVFAGAYSSGKSTLLNAIMRHNVLPVSAQTCTSKNCRIRHDKSLGKRLYLKCYDENENPVRIFFINNAEKTEVKYFENDADCAKEFLNICPMRENDSPDPYTEVFTMEVGADLSHLYPDSIDDEKFTIVLIDTPGMDSTKSIEDGVNMHAQIALDAISMESKPMILICIDAAYTEQESIGKIMKEILTQSAEKSGGFNDRFLFLMNKSDANTYRKGDSPQKTKEVFVKYLTSPGKWNIQKDEEELNQLAEKAARFVPRVFMTAAAPALAINTGVITRQGEDLSEDLGEDEYVLADKYNAFRDKLKGSHHPEYYHLADYSDVPNYRKDEIAAEFQKASKAGDDSKAVELQCGLASVESAIQDYLERYAYPIKVRDLLGTFENILEDVDGFTSATLESLQQAKNRMGEYESAREEVEERKKGVESKSAALEEAREGIKKYKEEMDKIKFDSKKLEEVIGNFQADIEADEEILFIRQHQTVYTGQKSREDVEKEVASRVEHIEKLFERTLLKTNGKLKELKTEYDKQLYTIFEYVKKTVRDLEKSGVLAEGKYNFKDSVYWKMNLSDIDSKSFSDDFLKKVVDKTTKEEKEQNDKKIDWENSWNPFKRIGALFMDDYVITVKPVDGYYETKDICLRIDRYLRSLSKEGEKMEKSFQDVMDESKKRVSNLIGKFLTELGYFQVDINKQEEKIKELEKNENALTEKIQNYHNTCDWLSNLKFRMGGEQ